MRRCDRATAIVSAALLACFGVALGGTPAMAQMPNMNLMPEVKSQTPEEKERDAIADKAYRESLRKIPDKTVNDPWGDVRSTDVRSADGSRGAKPAASKTATPKAMQAKRQTRTDGTAN